MIGRLLRSRGAKKFRRNRMAMASLLVIGAYVALAFWIVGTNTINERVTSLEDRPVLGMLLVSKTLEAVGPREMPGFGLIGSSEQQYEAGQFFLEIASNAFADIDRLGEDSDRAPGDVLADYAISGRAFADKPVEELRAAAGRARAQADRVLDVRRQGNSIGTLPVLAERLAEARAAFDVLAAGADADSEEMLNAMEDVAFRLEEIVESLGTFAGSDSAGALSQIDTDPIMDAVDAIWDAEDDPASAPMYDPGLIQPILDAAQRDGADLEARIAGEVDALNPIIAEIFPEPTGVSAVINDLRLVLGTDRQGRSILIRALYSAKVAIQVGVVVALIAVGFGSVLGAAGAFFGGFVDHGVNWLYSMFTSIPYLVLLAVLAMLFIGSQFEGTLVPLYVAFSLTYWIGPCRVIRGEAMKIKELEYVQAATAIGFGRWYILLRHIIPNTSHLMFINFSLLLIGAIKGEVILTFLGLGLKQGASWGIMIRDSAQQVVNDNFWQIGAATFFMFLLVLAFNIFTDALQDAFDPKHVG